MAVKASKVISMAKKYDGYLEKKTNDKLDDFKANAGSNNWTCFGRDYDKIMGTKLNGQSWCGMYLSMMFVLAYGIKAAKKLLGGDLFAYTPSGAKAMGAEHRKPKAGDVVFFYNSKMGRIAHVGLVIDVDATRFYTEEGNTSSDPGVVRNGGSVNSKSYPINYASARFATPCYGSVTEGTDTKGITAVKTTKKGKGGNENPYDISANAIVKKGSRGEDVKWVQYELNQWKSSLKIDGIAGDETVAQIRLYQKAKGLKIDGVCGAKTIEKLKND